jgi:hypothetical protein
VLTPNQTMPSAQVGLSAQFAAPHRRPPPARHGNRQAVAAACTRLRRCARGCHSRRTRRAAAKHPSAVGWGGSARAAPVTLQENPREKPCSHRKRPGAGRVPRRSRSSPPPRSDRWDPTGPTARHAPSRGLHEGYGRHVGAPGAA